MRPAVRPANAEWAAGRRPRSPDGRKPSPAGTATGSGSACRSAQSSLRRAVRRSASRREFANTMVERCSSTSSRIASSTCGHTEPAPVSPARSDRSSTGTVTRRSNFLPDGGATIDTGRTPHEEPGHLVVRPHGRGQPDALHRSHRQLVEPLERQCEVRAPLRARERVDLVDDDRLDAAQGLARRRREHEEERLGSRDEDLGRVRDQPAPLGRRRVARTDPDRNLGHLETVRRRGAGDADEGSAEVAFDIDAQRLQRREVDDLAFRPSPHRHPHGATGRSPRGTRRGSCPSRWGRPRGSDRRARWPATHPAVPLWAQRTTR